ncbi:TauD/TfdA family dioxygenase [Streptomyces sp. H10-C2]|uniref:TauD/TfdA dioxygenase family protein n=1 Tax=unclassified Streptomyces TaxID=2593676 RepID=UPI0024B9A09B|nr:MULTISPECIES: TauD/TfdA family dioxygenase [unclassified Streptomyces]MDJ0344306.1 TauD/TfdA family dioxygenase [Streptomyces sp. PH10-H1]MDJ0373675.1 TauD/TfdA family dioxygenase [Streptomyces sp. H10-C2]
MDLQSVSTIRTVKDGVRPALRARELSTGGSGAPYEHLHLTPYSPTIGAEVSDIDLARPVEPEVLAELGRALLEWKVLFFRGQSLTAEQHAAFARHWGEPEIHPFLPKAGIPEVVRLAHDARSPGVENVWHSDVSFSATPPLGSVLRAVEVPEVGGDTLWADMAAAYDGLPDRVKEAVEGQSAVHDFLRSFGQLLTPEQVAKAREKNPPVEHPVVRTHPETGRKLIYVNRVFTERITGLPPEESRELLDLLYDQARHPEYQCRFHWRPGSIAFWDNRVTQHYAASDYFPRPRVMERVTIIGDRPR